MIHAASGLEVFGTEVQNDTRCAHYYSDLDVIAIRFKCCDRYYPCHLCHQENEGHPGETWTSKELDERAILCGACGHVLTIQEYLDSGSTCTRCKAAFNPNCAEHYDMYFDAQRLP